MIRICTAEENLIELEKKSIEFFSTSVKINNNSEILNYIERQYQGDVYLSVNYSDNDEINYYIEFIEDYESIYKRKLNLKDEMKNKINIFILQLLYCIRNDTIKMDNCIKLE